MRDDECSCAIWPGLYKLCFYRLQEHPSLSLIGHAEELVGKSTPVKYFTSLLLVAILDQDVEMGGKPMPATVMGSRILCIKFN